MRRAAERRGHGRCHRPRTWPRKKRCRHGRRYSQASYAGGRRGWLRAPGRARPRRQRPRGSAPRLRRFALPCAPPAAIGQRTIREIIAGAQAATGFDASRLTCSLFVPLLFSSCSFIEPSQMAAKVLPQPRTQPRSRTEVSGKVSTPVSTPGEAGRRVAQAAPPSLRPPRVFDPAPRVEDARPLMPRRGRGAQSNVGGRFEPLAYAPVDDGWAAEDEPPPLKTR